MITRKWIFTVCFITLLTGCTVYAPSPSENSAVVSLIEEAEQLSNIGQFDNAGISLERAIRIEPRNPQLWHKLAQIRISQQLYSQAENLARKSNSLCLDNSQLRSLNWKLISDARRLNGDYKGAQEALRKSLKN